MEKFIVQCSPQYFKWYTKYRLFFPRMSSTIYHARLIGQNRNTTSLKIYLISTLKAATFVPNGVDTERVLKRFHPTFES